MLSFYHREDKILLVGPFPNPLGGVSVHTKRLYYLLKENEYNVSLFKLNKGVLPGIQWVKLIFHLLFNKYEVVHLQVFEPKIFKFILKLCKSKKSRIILTIHNPNVTEAIKNNVAELNKVDTIIAVGENIFESYKEKGITLTTELKVVPSYLPPNKSEEKEIVASYPQSVLNFIESRQKTILINASRLVVLEKGVDLYGVKTSIDLLDSLSKDLEVGLIIAIGDKNYNIDYYNSLKNYLNEISLGDKVYFFDNEMEIWPLFKKVDLFLRPTYYDGFGISVAEAIDMGCIAIASNVCKRAEGAILYEYGNFEELKVKSLQALNNK